MSDKEPDERPIKNELSFFGRYAKLRLHFCCNHISALIGLEIKNLTSSRYDCMFFSQRIFGAVRIIAGFDLGVP